MNLSTQAATAMLNVLSAQCNSGTLVLYSGTMATTPETALSGNTVLATFAFSATAFGSNTFTSGFETETASFTASSVTPTGAGSGTVVTFARAFKSDGTTVVADFTVGTSGTDITIANTTLQNSIQVTLNPFALKMPGV